MAGTDSRKLGHILVDQGVITPEQLADALTEQQSTGRFLGDVLVSRGAASEEQIAKSLSEQLGFAYVDMAEMTVEPKAIQLVPKDLCVKFTVMPIFISQNTLTVAMANALDVPLIDRIQSLSGLRVRPVFACPSAIRNSIERHYSKKTDEVKNQEARPTISPAEISSPRPVAAEQQVTSLQRAANLAPVIEKVTALIERAVEMGASDIHLEPERNKFQCRYRVDGILQNIPELPFEEQAAIISRIKIMAEMDIAEKRLPQDGRARVTVSGREVDLRVSTFPSVFGENVVIRILDRSGGLIRLTDLGFSKSNFEDFNKLIRRPYGMMLVTGPTGSGKTTTLYAALNEINDAQKNIITLEDPVEYELPNVRQSQINVKAGLTFATGLRSIVRQDPDIIMIGEIRDKETAEIAIHAALTGHLVFSTLHTNDAPSAAARLIDMGVEPFLVSSAVIGILAQRLLRTLCPKCKKEYVPSEELLGQLGLSERKGIKSFYQETGCPKCKNYGYSGRSAIFELLLPNERIKDFITKKSSAAVINEEAVKSGMKTLRDSGLEKVITGASSVSELLRVTENI